MAILWFIGFGDNTVRRYRDKGSVFTTNEQFLLYFIYTQIYCELYKVQPLYTTAKILITRVLFLITRK